jgi:acetyl esterase/lipase
MRFQRAALALSGLLAGAVPALAETPGERAGRQAVVNERIFGDTHEPWPERRTAFPGGVTGLADLTYSTIPGHRPLQLDLYLPPQGGGPRPLLIYVHGGGWMGGGRRLSAAFGNWPEVLASVAAEGFVVASISYRFAGEAPFPAAIHDTKNAVRWLRASAPRFGIDGARVGIWGASAGGQLAALVATSCGVEALAPPVVAPRLNPNVEQPAVPPPDMAAQSDCVQAAATWYGVFDFATLNRPEPGAANVREHPYLGCGAARCTEERLRAPSPVSYVRQGASPFLVIHGDADRTVAVAQSTAFQAKLQEAGIASEFVVLPGIDHSFIGRSAEETRETSRRMLARTVDFFATTLGAGR